MKKAVLLLAMFSVVLLSSCTDTAEENLPNETQKSLIENGEVGDDEDDEQQEGGN